MTAAPGSAVGFDDVQDLYQEVILQHGRHPRNSRVLADADASGRGDNPMCGDRVEVQVRFAPDGAVADAAFQARGCAVSIASADLMAEAARGLGPAELRSLAARFRDMARSGACPDCDPALEPLRPLSGVHEYPSRVRCATLPWDALQAALDGREETRS